jgi:hypothetical protein
MSFGSLVGLLLIAGMIGLILIVTNKKTQPGTPPAAPIQPQPTPQPIPGVKINAPFTFRHLLDQQFREDVLLAFEPLPGHSCGRLDDYGVLGVPYDSNTRRFADGWGINAKIYMAAWSEQPYSQPDGFDTVFVWSDIDNKLVPLGDNFTRFAHLRWFPGLRNLTPPYAAGPKDGCPPADPVTPVTVGGQRHTGRLIVTVKDPMGNFTSAEYVVGVWIAQCL